MISNVFFRKGEKAKRVSERKSGRERNGGKGEKGKAQWKDKGNQKMER